MKVFLVFLGLLLIHVTFISYQGDLSHYLKLRAYLKSVAEACAAGSAQYYDEEAYGQGLMVIKRAEAERYTAHLVGQAAAHLNTENAEALSYVLEIEDDRLTVDSGRSPAVTVTLRLVTPDLFRLRAIEMTEVVRGARYELARQ